MQFIRLIRVHSPRKIYCICVKAVRRHHVCGFNDADMLQLMWQASDCVVYRL